MAEVSESIEVNVPVRAVYNQWTQFESFPNFMEGVQQVQQLDDTHLHWMAEVNGKTQEWDAEVTEQVPDQVVAWRSISGQQNSGRVTFESIGADQTRVTVQMGWEPQGVTESIGSALGFDNRQVKQDLENFKRFIEERGAPTGAWRGEVHGGQTTL
jgi:uncharacterized membrane protein